MRSSIIFFIGIALVSGVAQGNDDDNVKISKGKEKGEGSRQQKKLTSKEMETPPMDYFFDTAIVDKVYPIEVEEEEYSSQPKDSDSENKEAPVVAYFVENGKLRRIPGIPGVISKGDDKEESHKDEKEGVSLEPEETRTSTSLYVESDTMYVIVKTLPRNAFQEEPMNDEKEGAAPLQEEGKNNELECGKEVEKLSIKD
uniref:Uncharacterized protein n=2 Tax=Spongospora subterranea TaxID=70186 RepID=A0A0H5RJE9_9EUKA|eukprot:CRZ08814.1 hypothetical protein [Spongospora subterranea]